MSERRIRTRWPGTGDPRGRGFTLVEILCVVVILGIVSAIIIPQIGTNDDLRAAAAARVVMSDLIYAQNRAITTQSRQYIIFDLPNNQYRLASAVQPTETLIAHPVMKDPYIVQFGPASKSGLSQQTMVSAAFNGDKTILAFDPLGTPFAVASDGSSAPLTSSKIVVGAPGFPMTITVEPFTGQITVQDGQ